jgi:hypothetical protein
MNVEPGALNRCNYISLWTSENFLNRSRLESFVDAADSSSIQHLRQARSNSCKKTKVSLECHGDRNVSHEPRAAKVRRNGGKT